MSEPQFEVLVGADPVTGQLPAPTEARMDTVVAEHIDNPDSDTRASLNATYAPIGSAPQSIPASGITPANTEALRERLAAVRSGSGDLKVMCIGDSVTAGALSEVYEWQPLSWPSQLAGLLDGVFAPAANSLAIPPYNGSSLGLDADPRWGMGTGWTLNNSSGLGFGSGVSFRCGDGDACDPLTFSPDVACDTFDIYVSANASASFQATLSISIDGGTATVVTTAPAGGSNEVKKITVTATLGAGHVLSIDPTLGGTFFIFAVDAYDSTASHIRVGNAGVSSSRANQWDDAPDGTNPWRSLGMIAEYAPDVTLIMLGINDAGASVTANSFRTSIQDIINTAKQSGDVWLMSVVPSSPSNAERLALEIEYRTQAQELALLNGCVFLDIFQRFGDWGAANTAGWMADATHPNATGQAQIAYAVRDALYFV